MSTPRHKKKQLVLTTVLVVILSISIHQVNAQSHKVALSLTGGIVQDGFGGLVTIDYKVNEFDYLQFNVQGNFTNLELSGIDVPVTLYSFNPGFFFDVLRNNSRTFALSLGAGGVIGTETINKGEQALENSQILNIETNTLIFGAYAGLDADIFLSSVATLNIKLNEYYHANSEVGALTPYAGIGIKLIIK